MGSPRLPAQGADFRIDLFSVTAWVRAGFSETDIYSAPEGPEWTALPPGRRTIRIPELGLPGIPERRFFSLSGAPEADFTISIPFVFRSPAGSPATENLIPALYLAGLGDNWEIWLNGSLIRREMHLDSLGKIVIHRRMRHIVIPFAENILRHGKNLLVIRLRGDPSNHYTGLYYSRGYYISDYNRIFRRSGDTFNLVLVGGWLFMGLYHLAAGLVMRKDRYNFFFAFFSFCCGFFFFTRSQTVFIYILDTDIARKIELSCLYLMMPAGAMFLELLAFKKIAFITKIYGTFFLVLALLQFLFSVSFGQDTLSVWLYSAIAAAFIVLFYDIGYGLVLASRDLRRQLYLDGEVLSPAALAARTLLGTPLGNISLGTAAGIFSGVFDALDSMFFRLDAGIARYGFFVFTCFSSLVLARRVQIQFSLQQRIIARANRGMHKRLVDCIVVEDQDPARLASYNARLAVMFTDVRNFSRLTEKMDSKTTTDFLSALNDMLAQPMFMFQDQGYTAFTDKFIGDGTMNIFADPVIALESAVMMRKQLELFNKNPRLFFRGAPEGFHADVGCGIAWGAMTVGVMGHSRRIDYTHTGGTVNLAARLESLTKVYHASVLINESLYRETTGRNFNLRLVDRIRAKGMDEIVEIYEEFSSSSPAVRDLKNELMPRYRELQEMYFSGKNWESALALAEELEARFSGEVRCGGPGTDAPADPVIGIYAARMRAIMQNPDLMAKWDGVYTFREAGSPD